MAQRKTASRTGGKRRTSSKSLKKAGASRQAKSGSANRAGSRTLAGNRAMTIDRRRSTGRRSDDHETAETSSATAPVLERRKKVNRRRQIDPTTCERDYTDQEVEFMNALDDYKRKSGRMFPTCSEVLEVVRSLGYVKLSATELAALGTNASTASAKPMPSNWQSAAATSRDTEGVAAREPEMAY